uniref:SET domain-containing protein n=2 Tax=Mesocestoides corti TaxID=53468 RepID=A0A5K3FE39_MESCO
MSTYHHIVNIVILSTQPRSQFHSLLKICFRNILLELAQLPFTRTTMEEPPTIQALLQNLRTSATVIAKDNWKSFLPDTQDFIKHYLAQYPQRPMVRMKVDQTIQTELHGNWIQATVVQVDASLALLRFPSGHVEWIYRGSTRLEPLSSKQTSDSGNNTSCQPVEVDYASVEASLASAHAPRQKKRKSATGRGISGVGKKCIPHVASGSLPPDPAAPTKHPSVKEAEESGRVVPYLDSFIKTLHIKAYVDHKCVAGCLKALNVSDDPSSGYRSESPFDYRGLNPLEIPIRSGWLRVYIKATPAADRRDGIGYIAPCGRQIRSFSELDHFLHQTGSQLTSDLFCFDKDIIINAEFRCEKAFTRIADLSYGKENVPVPCVNSVDNESPSFIDYITNRQPVGSVVINEDPNFLVCCDCTDNCRDRTKCTCQQLTIEASAFSSSKGMVDFSVGYRHRRLSQFTMGGIYECNSNCKCDRRCQNRVVQHGVWARVQVFKTNRKGWGIRALNAIPKGSFICTYAGAIYDDSTAVNEGYDFGDEYQAELDYIETVEKHKEGYEPYAIEPEDDSDFDPSSSVASTTLRSTSSTATKKKRGRGRPRRNSSSSVSSYSTCSCASPMVASAELSEKQSTDLTKRLHDKNVEINNYVLLSAGATVSGANVQDANEEGHHNFCEHQAGVELGLRDECKTPESSQLASQSVDLDSREIANENPKTALNVDCSLQLAQSVGQNVSDRDGIQSENAQVIATTTMQPSPSTVDLCVPTQSNESLVCGCDVKPSESLILATTMASELSLLQNKAINVGELSDQDMPRGMNMCESGVIDLRDIRDSPGDPSTRENIQVLGGVTHADAVSSCTEINNLETVGVVSSKSNPTPKNCKAAYTKIETSRESVKTGTVEEAPKILPGPSLILQPEVITRAGVMNSETNIHSRDLQVQTHYCSSERVESSTCDPSISSRVDEGKSKLCHENKHRGTTGIPGHSVVENTDNPPTKCPRNAETLIGNSDLEKPSFEIVGTPSSSTDRGMSFSPPQHDYQTVSSESSQVNTNSSAINVEVMKSDASTGSRGAQIDIESPLTPSSTSTSPIGSSSAHVNTISIEFSASSGTEPITANRCREPAKDGDLNVADIPVKKLLLPPFSTAAPGLSSCHGVSNLCEIMSRTSFNRLPLVRLTRVQERPNRHTTQPSLRRSYRRTRGGGRRDCNKDWLTQTRRTSSAEASQVAVASSHNRQPVVDPTQPRQVLISNLKKSASSALSRSSSTSNLSLHASNPSNSSEPKRSSSAVDLLRANQPLSKHGDRRHRKRTREVHSSLAQSTAAASSAPTVTPWANRRFYPIAQKDWLPARRYFGDEEPFVMDAKKMGNLGRYFNHSCEPNVFVQNVFITTHDPRFPEVAFFAKRNIAAGEEMTWDYGYIVDAVPYKVLYCYCEEPSCRIRLL